MKRYAKAQLNAISNAYTKKHNQQAYERIKRWFDSQQDCYHSLDQFIAIFKKSYNLKSNSYVVLEKCLKRREIM